MKNIHAVSLVKMALSAAILAVATLPLQAEQFDFYKLGRPGFDFLPSDGVNTGGDLTSSNVSGGIFDGDLNFNIGGLTATATASYTYNNVTSVAAVVQDKVSNWTFANSAGLGVYHYATGNLNTSDDNITKGEVLTITFNQTVNLSQIGLRSDGHNFTSWATGDQFLFNNTTLMTLPDNVGFINMNQTGSVFTFAFANNTARNLTPQFYLASMTVSRVPDGGLTVALLGGALVGLALLRRRFVR